MPYSNTNNEFETNLPEGYVQASFDFSDITIPRVHKLYSLHEIDTLHQALAPFINITVLRRLVAEGGNVSDALRKGAIPVELRYLLDTLANIVRPPMREQIRSSADIAALLMVEMSLLDQEELRTVLLDNRNRVQGIATIYRGSVNQAVVRIGEVFKEAIRYNSTSIILVHSHPSGDPSPSRDDLITTRKIMQAGKLLDIACLDHLIIGQGKWVSVAELLPPMPRK